MVMPMFIINQYKKKKKYIEDEEGETNYDNYEDLHEFNLQQVTYKEQHGDNY